MTGQCGTFGGRSFYWKISNFHVCPYLPGESICSPKFGFESADLSSLYLCLYPRGREVPDGGKFVSLFLMRDRSDDGPKYVSVSFKLILCDNKWIPLKQSSYSARFEKGSSYGNLKFLERRKIGSELHKEDFYIMCEFALKDDETETCSPWMPDIGDVESLSCDFRNALRDGEYHDLRLRSSDDVLFKAHKAIVYSRFPNIVEVLGSPESKGDELALKVTATTLRVLLQYLYTGKFDERNSGSICYEALYSSKLPHLEALLFPIPFPKLASTTIGTRLGSFLWVLPAFRAVSNKAVFRKTFSFDECTAIIVSLSIKKNVVKTDFLCPSIQLLSSARSPYMKCRIGLLNNTIYTKEYEHHFNDDLIWNMAPFIKLKTLYDKNLFEDTLKLSFNFQISNGRFHTEIKNCHDWTIEEGRIKSNFRALQNDLKFLYINSFLTDVVIHLGERTFYAHKFVLSARSSTFSKVLKLKARKGTQAKEIVELNETKFDADTVNAVLSYMYFGELIRKPQDIDFTLKLCKAADFFQLLILKGKCLTHFNRKLNVENIRETLSLISKYQCESLKVIIEDFVYFNWQDVLNSGEWKRVMSESPDMSAEMQNITSISQEIKPDILKLIIMHLYCRNVTETHLGVYSALKLYECAYKHGLLQIKDECVSLLLGALSPEHIGKIFALGDQYEDDAIKDGIRLFIGFNAEDILRSDQWNREVLEKTDMAEDLQNTFCFSNKLSTNTVLNLLSYIYCGKLAEKRNDVFSVLEIYFETCTYRLHQFGKVLISSIRELITAENVGKILKIALTRKDDVLVECISDFVRTSGDEVSDSNEWKLQVERLNLSDDSRVISSSSRHLKSPMIMTFLTYMYSGLADEERKDSDFVLNLYLNARKYLLLQMETSCKSYLSQEINAGNVGKMLVLAGQQADTEFQKCLKTYVVSHVEDILNSNEWKTKTREKLGLDTGIENEPMVSDELGPDTVLAILSYTYSENLEKGKIELDHVAKMYAFSNKLELRQVQEECNSFFEHSIDTENVGELLMLSEQYKDETLQKYVRDFISSNTNGILESNKWKIKMEEKCNLKGKLLKASLGAEDLEASTVTAVLSYAYSGNINSRQGDLDSVVRLYTFAKRHELQVLVSECVSTLRELIKIENIGEALALADANEDHVLEECLQNFVSSNVDKILCSVYWENLITGHSDFSGDVHNIALATKLFGFEVIMNTLACIYCGRLAEKGEDLDSLINLYSICSEHGLRHLKNMCVSQFQKSLTAVNVGVVSVAADLHSDESLKKIVRAFVCSNAKALLSSDEWRCTLKEHPKIASDILMAVLEAMANNVKENN